MSTDKKPEAQVTEAAAVELDESQLHEASGGADLVSPQPPPDARLKFSNVVLK